MEMKSKMMPRHFLLVLVIAIFVSSCGSARVAQFEKFALAGTKFADTVPPVLDQAFKIAVETDSRVLLESRKQLTSEEDRLDAIEISNENLKKRILLLNDLKRHASLLRSYFLALNALAQTEEASGISDVTKGLVDSMAKLDKRITEITIGALSLKDFAGQAASIAVAAFKSAALKRELKVHGKFIDHELDIQQAALTVLGKAMRADLEAQSEVTDRDQIVLPYVRAGALPKDWNARRLAAFKRQIEISSIDAAADAASALRVSFVALAENRLDETSIALLFQDIDRIITFIEGVNGNQ